MADNTKYKEYFLGAYHHVYNRGVNKGLIFKDQQDYIIFIKRLRFYKIKYKIDILFYCLMPNHFHLATKQLTEQSLSKMMQFLTNGYAMYFNRRHKRAGHLFESKFKAILANEDELLELSRYIHLNPLMAKIVNKSENWSWSSYLDYVGLRNGTLCNKKEVLQNMSPLEYKNFIYEDIERMRETKEYEKILRLVEECE